VGFANVSTAIVGRSRGTPIVSVAQLGYIAVTVLSREETDIKTLKDLEGKSWAISPGQAQWFLLPALARINNLDFKSIKIEETAPPLQPAALLAKKADFITMFRASNDEVAEMAAAKQGIRLKRIHMRDAGLDIYGSALIAKEEDIKRRPEMIRAYVEGTMEGLRYTRDHQEEALKILLKLKPELDGELTRIQIKNGVEEVFIPAESVAAGYGYMKPDVMEKTVKVTNEFFDGAGKVPAAGVYTNQFIRK
jgi:NitT/TauT family transport system substrate-binding protein